MTEPTDRELRPSVRRRSNLVIAALGVVALLASGLPVTAQVPEVSDSGQPAPVLAYYYIWFDPTSWQRAKTDLPLLGAYSSDERRVMEQHVTWAKQAGIDGFIVSWKSTLVLNRRLVQLTEVAREQDFSLTVIYQGLDFERDPLPAWTVENDLRWFLKRFGEDPVFDVFGKPAVIWSGTWEFSRPEFESVANAVRPGLLLLASERDPTTVGRLDGLIDGNAYYWSSANPDTYPDYQGRLDDMAAAVREQRGIWIAPAAPGFDARLIGGTSVVPRDDGQMLERQVQAALRSDPDALGLISWNEFSENSHIEPSENYSTGSLNVLSSLLHARPPEVGGLDSDAPAMSPSGGPDGLISLAVFTVLFVGVLAIIRRRREIPT